jgi:HrpA-like RNA helicase
MCRAITHPLEIEYAPGQTVAQRSSTSYRDATGNVLCFLPGAGEIERAIEEARAATACATASSCCRLHGCARR